MIRLILLLAALPALAAPLYRLEKDGKTNWILGTFHRRIDPAWLPPEVVEVAAHARVVYAESDALSEEARDRIRQESEDRIVESLSKPPRRNIKHELNTTDFLLLRSVFKTVDARIQNADYLPPSQLS